MYMLNIYILHVLIDMILFLNKYVFDIIILLLDINHIEIITYIYIFIDFVPSVQTYIPIKINLVLLVYLIYMYFKKF